MKSQWIRPGVYVLLFVLVASMWGGCAAPTAQPTQPPAAPAVAKPAVAPATAAPKATEPPAVKKGGNLVVVLRGEPNNGLDPQVQASSHTAEVVRNVFDPLLLKAGDGSIKPHLAESWEIAPDLTWMTFKLRKGVKFHDGTPLNAEAIKFMFDRVLDPQLLSVGAKDFIGPYDRTEVVDEFTAKVYWKKPYPFLNAMFEQSNTLFSPSSPTAVKKAGKDYGTTALVGTGPWIFKEWVARDHITIVKNPDYKWAPPGSTHEQAYLDTIVYKFIPEDATRAAVLQTGEAHLIYTIPAEWLGKLSADPKYKVINVDLFGPGAMYQLSVLWPGMEDVRVRKAVEFAVNREGMIAALYPGLYKPLYGPLSLDTPCGDKEASSMYKYDAAKAKALLAEAGWKDTNADGLVDKDGKPLFFEIHTISDARLGEYIQSNLRDVGIDAKAIFHSGGPLRMEKARAGAFGLMFLTWGSTDPGILYTLYHSSQIGGWQFSHYKDAELDKLLEQGAASAKLEERCKSYVQAQRLIMDKALVVPMYGRNMTVGYNAKVKGVVPDFSKDTGLEYFDVYIEP